MPSGRTHDSITLWSLPLLAGITFEQTQSASLTLSVAGGFLFSGLMFGPDLDIYSQQYKRWSVLRWIWLPYRKAMRHRSLWSHGPIVGTVIRVIYLLIWVSLFAGFGISIVAIGAHFSGMDGWALAQTWISSGLTTMQRSLQQSTGEWISLGLGLELGALSHVCSDWLGSAWKRQKKRGSQVGKGRSPHNRQIEAPLPPDLQIPWEPPTQPVSPPPPKLRNLPPSPLRREPQLPTFRRLKKD
jgi:uncharacterized metal-binding protein